MQQGRQKGGRRQSKKIKNKNKRRERVEINRTRGKREDEPWKFGRF